MPILDIEKAIKKEQIDSRFRLVNISSQRARELNSPGEGTLEEQSRKYAKVTTKALDEIIGNKVAFEIEEDKE